MSRPGVATRRALRLAVLLGLVAGTTAAGSTAAVTPAEAHVRYCGHRSHYDLRHPHFRMEFVSEFDRSGSHHHRVLFHRQLLGIEDWTTIVRCDHD
jgi:hypothetical protein